MLSPYQKPRIDIGQVLMGFISEQEKSLEAVHTELYPKAFVMYLRQIRG